MDDDLTNYATGVVEAEIQKRFDQGMTEVKVVSTSNEIELMMCNMELKTRHPEWDIKDSESSSAGAYFPVSMK